MATFAGLGGIGKALSAFSQEQSALQRSLALLEKQQEFSASEAEKSRKARTELAKEQQEFQAEQGKLARDQSKFLTLVDLSLKGRQLDQQDQKFMQDYIQTQQELGIKEQELDIQQEQLGLAQRRTVVAEQKSEQELKTDIARRGLIEQQTEKLSAETKLRQAKQFADTQSLLLNPLVTERDALVQANALEKDKGRTTRIKELQGDIEKIIGLVSKEQNRIIKSGGDISPSFLDSRAFILSDPNDWQNYLDSLPDDQSRARATSVARSINPKKLEENRKSVIDRLREESRQTILGVPKEVLNSIIGKGKNIVNDVISSRLGSTFGETETLTKLPKDITRIPEISQVPQIQDFIPDTSQFVGQSAITPPLDSVIRQGGQIPPGGFAQQQQQLNDLLSGRLNFRVGSKPGEQGGLIPATNLGTLDIPNLFLNRF